MRWGPEDDAGGESAAGKRDEDMVLADLTGQRFGKLTVLRRAENDNTGKAQWTCRCDCGRLCVVRAYKLKNGQTRSCGCERKGGYNRRDLTGRRFGRLTALCPAEKSGQAGGGLVWRCRCDCGAEAEVSAARLVSGRTRSCGCLNREQMSRMHQHMHYSDNTCLERLIRAQREQGGNKAGFRGLFRMKDGRYRATIGFGKARYYLGSYRDFDEAVKARQTAEETLHQGYIDARGAYDRRAEADPAWAEENPFFFHVERRNGAFDVRTNAWLGQTAVRQVPNGRAVRAGQTDSL